MDLRLSAKKMPPKKRAENLASRGKSLPASETEMSPAKSCRGPFWDGQQDQKQTLSHVEAGGMGAHSVQLLPYRLLDRPWITHKLSGIGKRGGGG